jgi:hypothetical protein
MTSSDGLLASAAQDEPTVNVGLDVSRAFVGFLHHIAPSALRFRDTGKTGFAALTRRVR